MLFSRTFKLVLIYVFFYQVDFATQPEKCRIKINNWVEKKTQHKIMDLFPTGTISSATKLVLASTLYFKVNIDYINIMCQIEILNNV